MRSLASVLLAVALVLLPACDGDNPERADTVGTDDSTTTTQADQEVGDLQARLLTVADLPTGFSEGSPFGDEDDAASDESDDDEPEFCDEAFSKFEAVEPKSEAERDFKRGDASIAGAAGFNQTLAEMDSSDQAAELFDGISPAFDQCKEFEETDEEGNTFKGSFSALSFPKLGDETFAFHMTASGGNGEFTIDIGGDFVFIRVGRVINTLATISFGESSISAQELEGIARTSLEKL